MERKRADIVIIDQRSGEIEPGEDAGHGQACAGIVRRLLPESRVHWIGLAALAGACGIAAAVRKGSGLGRVISVSLGTTTPTAELADACSAAVAEGTIIVAAAHNEGLVCYPAYLPTVIGVRGADLRGDDTYYYCPGQPIECIARGDAQRLRWSGGREVFLAGNSFAAPRIAAVVARLKAQHPDADLAQIRGLLRQGAARVIEADRARVSVPGRDPTNPPYHWIRRAALYPYTKEMHAFIRYRDLLSFEVVGVADPPGRGQVGEDAGTAIGAGAAGLQILASVRQATATADTLVLGYLRQFGRLRGRDVHREQVEFALDKGLNVFSFEPLPEARYADLHRRARERGRRIAWPAVAMAELEAAADDGPVDVPVLGVFGTSAAQGKFTLQLALRRHLLRRGYRVGQVGTEHHSELFGMDWAFPMGHGSTVEPGVEHYPDLVDRRMRRICAERRPDLIVVGAQSGTVPFDVHDHRTLTLPSLAFLLGAKPDVCILVVNAMDPEDYVADTIAALGSLARSPVLALAVSDRTRELREGLGRTWATSRPAHPGEVQGTLERLEGRFGVPAVQITSAAGIERLCDLAVDHFAAPASGTETRACSRKSA